MPSFTVARSLALVFLIGNFAAADQVKYLAHGEQALAEFIALTGSARKSIDAITFIYEPCHASTQVLMETLTQKAKAGVRVRLILDVSTQSAEQKQNIADDFARLGMEIRFYNDFAVYGPQMNLRSHAKALIVDGQTVITGGRNWSDEYFDISTVENWVDRDVMVSGKAAAQAQASFDEIWNSAMVVEPVSASGNFVPWIQFCGDNISARVKQVRDYFTVNGAKIISQIPEHSCASVKYVSDNPEFGNPRYNGDDPNEYMSYMRLQEKRTTNQFLKFLNGTKSTFTIENWIYIPFGFIDDSFSAMKERGVVMNVATNMTMDGPAFLRQAEEYVIDHFARRDSVGASQVRRLATPQLDDSFALTPAGSPFFVHGKVYVRDTKDVIVSSYNLDPRSYSTNVEAMAVIKNCPAFASDVESGYQSLSGKFDADKKHGVVYQLEDISFAAKLFGDASIELF